MVQKGVPSSTSAATISIGKLTIISTGQTGLSSANGAEGVTVIYQRSNHKHQQVNDHLDRIDLPTPANSAEDDCLHLSTWQSSSQHPVSCQRKTNKRVVKRKVLYLKKGIASLGRSEVIDGPQNGQIFSLLRVVQKTVAATCQTSNHEGRKLNGLFSDTVCFEKHFGYYHPIYPYFLIAIDRQLVQVEILENKENSSQRFDRCTTRSKPRPV